MTEPTKRDVERAIERLEDGDSPDGLGANSPGSREMKLLAGIDLDQFDLPDEAREIVEQAGLPDSRAPVVVDEDGTDAGDALATVDDGDTVGFDAETFLADARDTDRED